MVFLATVVVLAAALSSLLGSPNAHRGTSRGPAVFPSARTGAGGMSSLAPVTPDTVAPPQTPVQVEFDRALASGLESSPTVIAAERTGVPAPATSTAWPGIPVTFSPDEWAQQFVQRLLTVDFSTQSRAQLAAWLSAEEAPELLPGVPPEAADKVLNLSLLDPTAAGGATSPVPSAADWTALGQRGVTWSVGGLLVQPDPKWSQIVSDGWEPVDQRFQALDISGQLRVKGGTVTSTHRFTMIIYVGSAHWHAGYGTVAVSDWSEG